MPEPGHQPQSLHSRSSPDRLAAAHERAGLLLSDRYAEQSISERDFESLLARLRDATDIASVDAVVEELHLIPRESADLPDVQREQRRPSLPSDERRLLAVMSETKRKGRWEVPRLLRVRALMAEVKLDFRETDIPHGLTIDVHALMSQVTVIVPRDVIVDLDVFALMGSADNNAPEGRDVWPGARRIRISGSATMAEVKVIVRA